MKQTFRPGKAASGQQQRQLEHAAELHRQGNVAAARGTYLKLLKRDRDNPVLLNLLGLAEFQRGAQEDALKRLRKAIAVAPGVAKYHYDLGVVLQQCGNETKAVEHYRRAIELEPGGVQIHENLGVALFDSGDLVGARDALERALDIDSRSILATTNLATVSRWLGDHERALVLLDEAIKIDPLNAEIRAKRAEARLALGDYETGWPEYAWRLLTAGDPGADRVHHYPLPRWSGESLDGRRLLVHREQGIGDEVMFAGCLPELAARDCDVTVLCDPRLAPLFARSFNGIAVWPDEGSPADWEQPAERVVADFRLPIGDLAAAYRGDAAAFEPGDAYLVAEEARRERWRARLEENGDAFFVGLSWRGGSNSRTRQARSIDLAALAPLFDVPSLRFVNLQYGDVRRELRAAPKIVRDGLINFAEIDPLRELEDFCGLIAALDLVISVDNSTVHFAGALGTPTWMLAPALTDWRWPSEGDASRWYRSVSIVRSPEAVVGEWRPMIDDVAKRLREFRPESVNRPRPTAVSRIAEHPPPATARALLLNDTAYWYHFGCTCTSLALRTGLRARGWAVRGVPAVSLQALDALPHAAEDFDAEAPFHRFQKAHPDLVDAVRSADTIVLNGEGSLHDTTPLALGLLYLARMAKQRFGKAVHIINHSCYPVTKAGAVDAATEGIYRLAYADADSVVIREPESLARMRDVAPELTAGFDCLPLFVDTWRGTLDIRDENRLLIAGSAVSDPNLVTACAALFRHATQKGLRPALLFGANAYAAADERVFAAHLAAALDGALDVVFVCSALEWLAAIGSARALVSGRFHHSIAAACLDTPFVVVDSNTDKISGLLRTLELDNRLARGALGDPDALIASVDEILAGRRRTTIGADRQAELLASAQRNFHGLSLEN